MIVEINKLIAIVNEASKIIMGYYKKDSGVKFKEDNSPVTLADIEASNYIISAMKELTDFPIISEEDDIIINQKLSKFWLIDPLDGTKSFIRHDQDFSINIGLVEDKIPILGIVHLPFASETYYNQGNTAFKRDKSGNIQEIKARVVDMKNLEAVIGNSATKLLNNYPEIGKIAKVSRVSSAKKFCLLAEGKADIYPRFGRTMEWDSAAGHSILNAAGGSVTLMNGDPLVYSKDNFINPDFIAWAKR